jgi:hypothetical protein
MNQAQIYGKQKSFERRRGVIESCTAADLASPRSSTSLSILIYPHTHTGNRSQACSFVHGLKCLAVATRRVTLLLGSRVLIPRLCSHCSTHTHFLDLYPCHRYTSHPALKLSDHKPVRCVLSVTISTVDAKAFSKVLEQIHRSLDAMENQSMPDAKVNTNTIDVGVLRYGQRSTTRVTLTNVGQVLTQFR